MRQELPDEDKSLVRALRGKRVAKADLYHLTLKKLVVVVKERGKKGARKHKKKIEISFRSIAVSRDGNTFFLN